LEECQKGHKERKKEKDRLPERKRSSRPKELAADLCVKKS
jgi:hypothetical protein